MTNRGTQYFSLGPDGRIDRIEVDVDILGMKVEAFWNRLAFSLPLYHAQLFGKVNCPADPEEYWNSMPWYEGDLGEGWDFTKSLLAEASAMKQRTIPFGAYVQLEIGNVKAAKLYEVGADVICVLVNHAGEYTFVWIKPLDEKFTYENEMILGFISGRRVANLGKRMEFEEAMDRFHLAISIPLAAIIRAFWVVEDRQSIFGVARNTKKAARLLSDRAEPSIVYLPRIRYIRDIEKLAAPLHLESRRAHFVTGHLRKALKANKNQIILAQRFGVVVPAGFTFVRPHQRGERARDIIYRSRSALQCIRALRPVGSGDEKDAWFSFEVNVAEWLKNNGFEVEHISGSRNGDGGVDIQARKRDEILVIQCKYWHRTKVGPSTVRELIGTLADFPEGTKGVIVTSAELTSGAKEAAIHAGIQFLENVDFACQLREKLAV